MKRITAMEVAKLVGCSLWAATAALRAENEPLSYHFIRFEPNEGYRAGEFRGAGDGLQLLQGSARIAGDEGGDAGQYVELAAGTPYASIHFHGERVSRNHRTYYEVWVRPSASQMAKSEEFLDFDGAVLGFFAAGPDEPATFHAYHSLPEQEGHWVSTGVSAAVGASGMSTEWIRIEICQNLATGTWDLGIGGLPVLTEIRNALKPQKDTIQLWLLGHETRANRFDDLLVSSVDPDLLRLGETQPLPPGRSSKAGPAPNLGRTGERTVGRKQSDDDRRRNHAGTPGGGAKTTPKTLDFDTDIVEGGTQHGKFDDKNSESDQSITIYSPQYDHDGNPLPLKVRIQCDGELAEGVDLSKIVWVVTELPGKKNIDSLKVIAHGSFATGFTQIAEIPPEWAKKGTQIRVGTDLILQASP